METRLKAKKWIDKIKGSYKNRINKDLTKIVVIIGILWILIDAFWTILNIYDYYKGENCLQKNNFLWVVILVLPIIITVMYLQIFNKNLKLRKENDDLFLQNEDIIRFYRNIIEECFEDILKEHASVLEKDIKNAYEKDNWEQVIKLGKYGARLFLMLAKYDLRIKYGEYIIKAAKKIERPQSIAMGYIDCIGWSYVCKKEYMTAEATIKLGLDVIDSCNDKESIIMKCKAYRHLVGIKLRQNDIQAAKENRDIFEKYLRKLNGRNRQIMLASFWIINGDILEKSGTNYEDVKHNYEKAYEKYIKYNDMERAVKVRYKLGMINNKMNQSDLALKNYLMGFWMADKISRIDEKLKNCKEICNMVKKDPDMLSKLMYDVELKEYFDYYSISWNKEPSYYEKTLKQLKDTICVP